MEPTPGPPPTKRCLAALLLVSCLAPMPRAAGEGYRIVIDAGSTGSRLKMFQWQQGHLVEIAPSEDDEDHFRVEPGLSSYVESPELAGPSLQSMLVAAERYVPEEARADTLAFLMATAGVRLMNATAAQYLLLEVERYLLENSPFHFERCNVLSGVQEGVSALLSVNALLGYSGLEVGMLDLGGESTQVAFQPKARPLNFDTSFYVDGTLYSIYATSYTTFGTEATWQRALDKLAAQRSGNGEVDFPCYATGEALVANITDAGELAFRGTGDADACSTLVSSLLHLDYECLLPPCAMAGRYVAGVEGIPFYALNAFFYSALNLGLVEWGDSKVLSPAEISRATAELCGKTKDQALADSPQPWKYLEKGCLEGYHVYHILLAYGFSAESTSLTFAREINGIGADWTLGELLFEEYNPRHFDELTGEGDGYAERILGQDIWMVVALALGLALAATCLACWLAIARLNVIAEGRSMMDYHRGFAICPATTEEPSTMAVVDPVTEA